MIARSALGLGLYWLWGYVTFHSPAMMGASTDLILLNGYYLASLGGSVAGFLLLALGQKKLMDRWAESGRVRRAATGASLLVTATGLVLPVFFTVPAVMVPLEIAGGASSAFLPVAWGCVLMRSESKPARLSLALGALLAGFAVPSLDVLPWALGRIVATVAPVASAVLLPEVLDFAPGPSGVRHLPLRKALGSLRWFLLSVLAYGVAMGCFRGVLATGIGLEAKIGSMFFFGGVAAASVAIALSGIARIPKFDAALVYKVTLPVVMAAILLLLVSTERMAFISAFLIGFGYICFDLGAWILVASIARRARLSPALLFALMSLASHLGMLAGALLGTFSLFSEASIDLTLALTGIFLVAAATPTFGRINIVGVGERAEGDVEAGPSATDERAAALIAERFGLTRRESEILGLLLEGRSRDYIEKQLVLSKSTVKTHVRHIYEKTGVHGQQELLSLADEAKMMR